MKALILLLCLGFTVPAFSKVIARVIDVKGNAFVFAGKKAQSLKYGSKVLDLSEVMVEDGSTLSLVNNNGHIIHVNGGSLVKFYNGIAELKNGYVWVNVKSSNSRGFFNTTNSIANYGEGQFVYSFDNITGKTQLLVLTGDVKFSNALEPSLHINVPSGHFSLVDSSYESGLPRTATKVGLKSYKSMKSVFANFDKLNDPKLDEMMMGPKKKSRGIASVNDQFSMDYAPGKKVSHTSNRKRGKLIEIKTYGNGARTPASVGGPMEYYGQMKHAEAQRRKPVKTGHTATVRYFGQTWSKKKPVAKTTPVQPKKQKKAPARVPASIQKSNLINELQDSTFEKSLKEESTQIRRHSNEVNSLIDELNTYKNDYQKAY